LLLLAAILAIVALLVSRRPKEREPIDVVAVVIASQDIEPYSIVSSSQVTLGSTKIAVTLAKDYYETSQEVTGLMTTRFIKAGQQISREDAKLTEKVRYVQDMKLEIVSFPAIFSEMVGGQLRAGHRVNIYGYRTETGQGNPGETVLVAGNVWVVDVRTGTGEEPRQGVEESEQEGGGLFGAPSVGLAAQPASVLTVAAPPEVVRDIIYAFGAKGYDAWVTLAPSPENIPTGAIVRPTATPPAQATPTAPAQTPQVVQTPSSLVGAVYMSYEEDGPKTDTFPNNTSVVWAIVSLQYSPAGSMPIRLDVRDQGGTLVFEGDFIHPRSGQESYLIIPASASGFTPDTTYTTTLHAGGKTFSVEWELCGNASLPATGEDTPMSGGD